jgi:hypothetical protein
MRIRDDELDAAQAAPGKLPEEGRPEGFCLGWADIHAQNLTPTIGIDAHGHRDSDRDDAPVLADFDISGVDPQIGPVALDGPVEEGFDAIIDLFAQAAHLAFRDAAHAHGLDQIIH